MHHVADGEHAPPNVDAVAGHPSVAKASALQNVHNRPLRLTAIYAHAALAKTSVTLTILKTFKHHYCLLCCCHLLCPHLDLLIVSALLTHRLEARSRTTLLDASLCPLSSQACKEQLGSLSLYYGYDINW